MAYTLFDQCGSYQHMTTAKVKVVIVEEHSIVGGWETSLFWRCIKIINLWKNNP